MKSVSFLKSFLVIAAFALTNVISARAASKVGELSGDRDVRLRDDWRDENTNTDRYVRANDPDAKRADEA